MPKIVQKMALAMVTSNGTLRSDIVVQDTMCSAAEAMVTQRAMRGVLGNFLGTYMSRNSDYGGYWLFGFLVADVGELQIDLMAPQAGKSGTPLGVAIQYAAVKFADQVQKAGLMPSQIRAAWLAIRRLPGPAAGSVNDVPCAGHNVSFSAGAVMEVGRRYEREGVVFVAPHNAGAERRSARAAEPGAAANRGRM